jgi:hypothetical protein
LAPVEEVWPLVAEVARWKDWSFVDRSELDVEGAPVPDAVGAVRSLTRYGVGSKEEVVAWDPPSHLGYRILKGFPVRDYRADVVLTEAGRGDGGEPDGGTLVTWSVRFEPRYPGTGAVVDWTLQRIIQQFLTSLTRYADRRYAAGP